MKQLFVLIQLCCVSILCFSQVSSLSSPLKSRGEVSKHYRLSQVLTHNGNELIVVWCDVKNIVKQRFEVEKRDSKNNVVANISLDLGVHNPYGQSYMHSYIMDQELHLFYYRFGKKHKYGKEKPRSIYHRVLKLADLSEIKGETEIMQYDFWGCQSINLHFESFIAKSLEGSSDNFSLVTTLDDFKEEKTLKLQIVNVVDGIISKQYTVEGKIDKKKYDVEDMFVTPDGLLHVIFSNTMRNHRMVLGKDVDENPQLVHWVISESGDLIDLEYDMQDLCLYYPKFYWNRTSGTIGFAGIYVKPDNLQENGILHGQLDSKSDNVEMSKYLLEYDLESTELWRTSPKPFLPPIITQLNNEVYIGVQEAEWSMSQTSTSAFTGYKAELSSVTIVRLQDNNLKKLTTLELEQKMRTNGEVWDVGSFNLIPANDGILVFFNAKKQDGDVFVLKPPFLNGQMMVSKIQTNGILQTDELILADKNGLLEMSSITVVDGNLFFLSSQGKKTLYSLGLSD